jgi:hypothetical protein
MTNWDDEIDDVARQITAGKPDTGLRARVLARIEVKPWWSRRSVWAWSPVALVATAVVAILIVRPGWKSEDAAPKQRDVAVRPSGSGEARTAPTVRDVGLQPDTTGQSKPSSVPSSSTQSPLASARRSPVTPDRRDVRLPPSA